MTPALRVSRGDKKDSNFEDFQHVKVLMRGRSHIIVDIICECHQTIPAAETKKEMLECASEVN